MDKAQRGIYAFLRVTQGRTLSLVLLIVSFIGIFVFVASSINLIYVYRDDAVETFYTVNNDIAGFMHEQGFDVSAYDKVIVQGVGSQIGVLEIKKAFPVSVVCDGERRRVYMTEGTVADALLLAEVVIDDDDLINMQLSELVFDRTEIIINRVEYVETITTEDIPFEEEQKLTPLLRSGRQRVLSYGEEGTLEIIHHKLYIDGELAESDMVSTRVLRPAQKQVTLVGSNVAVSDIYPDFYVEMDENGIPVQYSQVYKGVKATAYSARPGAGTASGLKARVGHVAVNPNVIPYGSTLYIRTEDGSFIYGYAIAADTGTGLMDGRTGIDLFFESYLESVLFEVKYVDVYVLS